MSYVDAAINRLKDDAERKAATTPTPDAGVLLVSDLEDAISTASDVLHNSQEWHTEGVYADYITPRVNALLDHIATLTAQLAAAKADGERYRGMLLDAGFWQSAPCTLCGYNGPDYFKPSVHACAAARTGVR